MECTQCAELMFKDWCEYDEVFDTIRSRLDWEFNDEVVDLLVSRILKDVERF